MHAWVEEKLKKLEAQKLRRKLDLPQGVDLTSNDTLSLKNAPQLLNARSRPAKVLASAVAAHVFCAATTRFMPKWSKPARP